MGSPLLPPLAPSIKDDGLHPDPPNPPDESPARMKRRSLTRNACVHCRNKRRKCDGQDPCGTCRALERTCTYLAPRRESKLELRSEVERLTRLQDDADSFCAILLSEDAAKVARAMHSLRHGESLRAIVGSVQEDDDADGVSSEIGSPTSDGPSHRQSTAASESTAYDDQSLTGVQVFDFGSPKSLANRSSTSRDLQSPESHQSSSAGDPRQSGLVKTMISVSFIGQNIDLLLTWEFPPLTMIQKSAFESDFVSGRIDQSSPALVAAILSISSRLWDLGSSKDTLEGNRWSDVFAKEAHMLLAAQTADEMRKVSTIQTLALLSLRAVRDGNEDEARDLSGRSVAATASLMLPMKEDDDANSADSIAGHHPATFCGVFILSRLIDLVTRSYNPANLQAARPEQAGRSTNATVSKIWATLVHDLDPRHRITALIFELTELVHSSMLSAGTPDFANIVMKTYHDCLHWYSSVLATLKHGGQRPLFAHFIHIYYQFCILALLSPLVDERSSDTVATSDDMKPEPTLDAATSAPQICMEASQAVIALTQTYGGLCSLRRAPIFAPYFIYSSAALHLRLEGRGVTGVSGSTPQLRDGAVTSFGMQAIALLDDMAPSHPSAVEARTALRRSMGIGEGAEDGTVSGKSGL